MSEVNEISLKRKILFCISGKADTGKTNTLIDIYNIFISKFGLQKKNLKSDFLVIFTINVINTKYTIGINSAGDISDDIKISLNKLKLWDHIICACRSKGATKDAVEQFANQNGFTGKFITKSYFEPTPKNIEEYEKLNEYITIGLYSLFMD